MVPGTGKCRAGAGECWQKSPDYENVIHWGPIFVDL